MAQVKNIVFNFFRLSILSPSQPQGYLLSSFFAKWIWDLHFSIHYILFLQVKKHIKQGQGHEGGIFTVEAPLHVSNVQVLDPVTESVIWKKQVSSGFCNYIFVLLYKVIFIDVSYRKPCKIGIRYLEDGTKVRVSRGIGASESIIPRPEILKIRTTPRPTMGKWQHVHYPL